MNTLHRAREGIITNKINDTKEERIKGMKGRCHSGFGVGRNNTRRDIGAVGE